MSNTVDIKFRLTGPDINFDTFGWLDLKEFLDKLMPALASMEEGPTARNSLPIRVEEGSAQPVLRMPRASMEAVYRWRAGPTSEWSRDQLYKASKVYDFLAERNARLECGARALKPVQVPEDRTDWRVTEKTTLRGTVRRAGGKEGRVEVGFDGSKHIHCTAGTELAKQLGAHLYEKVEFTGTATREPLSRTLVGFTIESFRPVSTIDFEDGLRRLSALLPDDYDARAHLELVRGKE